MINLRVDDLDGMLGRLRTKGVAVSEPTSHVTGRFARLQDGEGNPIELWEPVPEEELRAIEAAPAP